MSNKEQPLGMPSQCIETAEAFIKVYGEEETMKLIDRKIDALCIALKAMKKAKSDPNYVILIATEIDFWSQTKQSIAPPVLNRSFFEGLNPVQ